MEIGGRIGKILKKKQSVFANWLLTYIFLLFLPILVSFFLYTQGKLTIEKEIRQVNTAYLQQMQLEMDSYLGETSEMIYKIGLNSDFQNIVYQSINMEEFDRYLVLQTVHTLQDYRRENDFIDEIFIYLSSKDKVLTTTGLRDSQEYFTSMSRMYPFYKNLTFDQWKGMVKSIHDREFIKMSAEGNREGRTEAIYFVNSVPFSHKSVDACIFVRLNMTRLENIYKGYSSINNGTCIILNKNNLLFHSGEDETLPDFLDFDRLTGTSGDVVAPRDGSDLVVTYCKSKILDLTYIYAVSSKVFWNRLTYIKRITFVSIAFCIFIGVLLAFTFTRKNYSPIRKLLDMLENRRKGAVSGNYNEYQYLNEMVNSAINENERYSNELRKQNMELKANFISKLMKGKLSDLKVVEAAMSKFDVKFDSDCFGVLIFYISNLKIFAAIDPVPGEEGDDVELARFIAANVFGELAAAEHICYCNEIDDMVTCLINFRKGGEAAGMRSLSPVIREGEAFIKEKFGIELMVSASECHKGIFGISQAYQEALNVMGYKITTENRAVVFYDEIREVTGVYEYPLETEYQFINNIKTGDFDAAKAILDHLFSVNFEKTRQSTDMVKCFMFDLASTMLKTIPRMPNGNENPYFKELNITGRLLACEKVQEMKHQITEILMQICSYVQHNKPNKKDELIGKIIHHIEKNYQDENLNVSTISYSFDLTPAYLTHRFKDITGETLFEYINRIRMDMAKQLLKDKGSSLSIKDVAQAVGYNNSGVFIRAFKKYEGVTPGSFRESFLSQFS